MNTSVAGTVSYCTVQSVHHPITHALMENRVRVVIRQAQRGAPLVHATVDTGAGTDGLNRANAMRLRLRAGTACIAIGTGVRIKRASNGAEQTIAVVGCTEVRGGEHTPFHELADKAADAIA